MLGAIIISPWTGKGKHVKPSDLIGREVGVSKLPSFRPPPTEKELRVYRRRKQEQDSHNPNLVEPI